MDWVSIVSIGVAAVGDVFAAGAAFFAWRALVAGRETATELNTISRSVKSTAGQLDTITERMSDATSRLDDLGGQMATVANALSETLNAIERMRQEERLLHRLNLYERLHSVIVAMELLSLSVFTVEERIAKVREAQVVMQAVLAVLPGVTGHPNDPFPHSWRLSNCRTTPEGLPGANITSARVEVENAIREVQEEMKLLTEGDPPSG